MLDMCEISEAYNFYKNSSVNKDVSGGYKRGGV